MTEEIKVIDSRVAGIILSGGAGVRMGGVDKGLQHYKGITLVEHLITCLTPQTSSLIVSANRNIQHYQNFDVEGLCVIQDEHSSYQGPLAGISAALKYLLESNNLANYAVIGSCDTPLLPNNYVARLLDNIGENSVAAAHDGARRQNLHCLIERRAWQDLIDYFESGERAVWQWQNQSTLVEVDFSDQANAFSNINNISDFAKLP